MAKVSVEEDKPKAPKNNQLRKFYEQTTLHGFMDAVYAETRCLRVFWWCVIVVFTVAVILIIYQVVDEFIRRPVVTTYEFVSTPNFTLPPIEICVGDTVNSTRAMALGISPAIISKMRINYPSGSSYLALSAIQDYTDTEVPLMTSIAIANVVMAHSRPEASLIIRLMMTQHFGRPPNQTEEELAMLMVETHLLEVLGLPNTTKTTLLPQNDVFLMHHKRLLPYLTQTGRAVDVEKLTDAISLDIDKVILKCLLMPNKLVDCKKNAQYVLDPSYGNCILLDLHKQQTIAGSGLLVLIAPFFHLAWTDPPVVEEAVTIRIEREFNPASLGSLTIGPGTYAKVELSATKFELTKSERYGSCLRDMERVVTTYPYTDTVCTSECALQAMQNLCNCTSMVSKEFRANPKQFKLCEIDQINCVEGVGPTDYFECQKHCRPQCSYWHYAKTVSYSKFPSRVTKQVVAGFPQNLTSQINVNDAVMLEVSFGALQYIEVDQHETISIFGLICQIGGNLGLFLGASFMSFIQIFVLFFACDCVTKKKDKKQSTDSQQPNHLVGNGDIPMTTAGEQDEAHVTTVTTAGEQDEAHVTTVPLD